MSDAQQIVKHWIKSRNSNWSAYAEYCHLVEEVGELGEALAVQQGERQSGSGEEGLADHHDMNEKIGDVLFSILVMANRQSVDVEACFNTAIDRYNKKVKKHLSR